MTHFGALIGALFGFIAAQVPELIEMLKDRFSHQRGMESKQQELDFLTAGYQTTIHEQSDTLNAQASEIDLLKKQAQESDADNDFKGHVALQFLRSSVRPVITYGFFTLFAIVTLFSLHHALIVDHMPISQTFPLVWDGDTEDLFAAVIAFWFGSRATANRPSNSVVNARNDVPCVTGKPTSILQGTGHIVGE
jgi:hypothetical protein